MLEVDVRYDWSSVYMPIFGERLVRRNIMTWSKEIESIFCATAREEDISQDELFFKKPCGHRPGNVRPMGRLGKTFDTYNYERNN